MAPIPRDRLLRIYLSCFCTALGMFMYGYDASTFNTVNTNTYWNNFFGDVVDDKGARSVSSNTIGLVPVGYSLGTIITGFFVSSILSDLYGRRVPMFVGALFVLAFSFLQAFSPNLATHVVGRTGIGLGQGLMLPAGPVYIGEIAPRAVRGQMMSFWQLVYSVGAFFSYLVGLITGWHNEMGDWQWRLVILLQIVAPIVFCPTIWLCPESPRWLVYKGRVEEARQVLNKLRADEDVEPELEEMVSVIQKEQQEHPGTWAVYKLLFTDKAMLKRLGMAMFINAVQQLTGQNSLNNYSSQIYKKVFNNQNTTNLINVINSICGILFTLNSTIFSDRIGRIALLVIGGYGMAVCMLIVGTLGTITFNNGTINTIPVGVGITFMLFAFIFFYKPTWGATVWIYTGEIFPVIVRAQANGIATQTQNVAGLALGYLFPVMLAAWNWKTFYFFMAINVVAATIVWVFYPESKGVPLEEMNDIFEGRKNNAERTAAVEVVEAADKK